MKQVYLIIYECYRISEDGIWQLIEKNSGELILADRITHMEQIKEWEKSLTGSADAFVIVDYKHLREIPDDPPTANAPGEELAAKVSEPERLNGRVTRRVDRWNILRGEETVFEFQAVDHRHEPDGTIEIRILKMPIRGTAALHAMQSNLFGHNAEVSFQNPVTMLYVRKEGDFRSVTSGAIGAILGDYGCNATGGIRLD